ncbi:hypothetical protein C5167_037608 [Papaver somniferum]|uniref:Fe2OG dioxygenase domain-containing protein n=1 Tax=Papaver somniferum TaxID=3469 RepID=A0A4Y7IB86_PAPSO|nr:RNA demethylase ALKBH5-like [Papaver somniferum]RZC44669.1 hypothetical protein C5167_037608 [Papaver somniferum]
MGGGEKLSSGDKLIALLPYLTEGFCEGCAVLLQNRLQNIGNFDGISMSNGQNSENAAGGCSAHTPEKSLISSPASSIVAQKNDSPSWGSSKTPLNFNGQISKNFSPASASSQPSTQSKVSLLGDDESDEQVRLSQVGRKKDYTHFERVDGKQINVLRGLELHTKVFSAEEQKKIVDYVYKLQKMGQAGKLRERTYTEPSKWKRGKGRVTLQFGCCYNYAVDKKGNPPGIIRDEDVDPLPPMFKEMIKRLVKWQVLPPSHVPNSCIVNIYDEGDCIPPHIDHHDFVRPFCTVSFLTECDILFGAHLKVVGDGEFSGPVSIALPVGSVLILSGNGADVAKHCVPGVPSKRISITFRKMDDSKLPYDFCPDPELKGLEQFRRTPSSTKLMTPRVLQSRTPQQNMHPSSNSVLLNNQLKEMNNIVTPTNIDLGQDNFPSLGSSNNKARRRGA